MSLTPEQRVEEQWIAEFYAAKHHNVPFDMEPPNVRCSKMLERSQIQTSAYEKYAAIASSTLQESPQEVQ